MGMDIDAAGYDVFPPCVKDSIGGHVKVCSHPGDLPAIDIDVRRVVLIRSDNPP